jgi:hypothetical protein
MAFLFSLFFMFAGLLGTYDASPGTPLNLAPANGTGVHAFDAAPGTPLN